MFVSVFLFLISLLLVPAVTFGQNDECLEVSRFTFSWQWDKGCDLIPRGGTTQGGEVTISQEESDAWRYLNESGLTKQERDRRAILAMSGPYRASFDFLEIQGYQKNFEPDVPYQSWGTEYIYVVEDSSDFVSLQHILVMFFMHDGELVGPHVMKHWRQDWHYERQENLVFQGDNVWLWQAIPREKIAGSWSQSVFQVDDSPRYESFGYWEHKPGFSTWKSHLTRRPLPRREFSVRDDYDVLEGFNRHTVLPDGWIQEEENWKVILDPDGDTKAASSYVAKELGIARYDTIVGHDFSAGDAYWDETQPFWSIVRSEWSRHFETNRVSRIAKSVDGVSLFSIFFDLAAQYRAGKIDDGQASKQIVQTIHSFTHVQE
ncbi:MAG: DUF6607 family protein [Pseudomonadota bacterium]